MVFAFQTDTAHKVGFRTDIIRGEDGSLALGLKNTEKLNLSEAVKHVLSQAMALSLPMVHFSTAFGRGRSKELTILPLCFITKKNMKTRIQT